jgi:hypothetical protein
MDTCNKMDIVPRESYVILQSPHHVSTDNYGSNKPKLFPLPRRKKGDNSSACRRAASLAGIDDRGYKNIMKSKGITFSKVDNNLVITVNVASEFWLPAPFSRRAKAGLFWQDSCSKLGVIPDNTKVIFRSGSIHRLSAKQTGV